MLNLNDKKYDTVLQEASDYFQSRGMSILGEGYKEIATNTSLFESYVDQLTEGCSPDDTATMAQLMANTNSGILKESSMTGIQPIASLSMPIIRKLWPKFALKDAITNEVAKSPRFVVSYTAPYMYKGDEKISIPSGLVNKYTGSTTADGEIPGALKKNYTVEHTVTLAAGAAQVVNFKFTDGVGTVATTDPEVVIADTGSLNKVQPLDELVFVSGLCGATAEAAVAAGVAGGTAAAIKLTKRLGVYGNAVYDYVLGDGSAVKGQIIVQFDGANDKATFAVVGTGGVELVVKAGVSSEYNESSWSVAFDIKRQDIDIPTGEHINAPLPIEALNDMMALYQIDGTKETVDLMTNVFAMKLDLEILDFLRDSFANQPNDVFDADGYKDASEFCVTFDCLPAAGFAGSPKAWREEIKPEIDWLAQKIKNQTYLQSGIFTIVANPLDAQILANVDWQFRGGQGGNTDGVDVDYSVGTYVGANAYKVIASTNVPAGAMYIVFCPSTEKQMTYKYYPYTFSTEMGYIDPNRSKTPSILMVQRHTMHEFMPAIGAILVKHNTGSAYSNYVPTKAWTSENNDRG